MKTSWMYVLLLSCLVLTAWATDETDADHDDDDNDNGDKVVADAGDEESEDATNMKLKVTTLLVEPFMMQINNTEGEMEFVGYLADVLKVLAEKADFRYKIDVVEDGLYGQPQHGHWTGLMGEIHHGGYDLAVAPLARNDIRAAAVDFTPPFMEAPATALVKADWELKTLKCIMDWKELNIVAIKDGYTFESLRQTKSHPISDIYPRVSNNYPDRLPESTEEGIEMVKSDEKNTTFIMEKPMADWAVKEDCDLETIEEFRIGDFNQTYSFAMPKGHPKYDDIKKVMAEMFKDGTFQNMAEEWWKNECTNDSVTINKMSAIFVAMTTLLGLLFAQL